MTTQGLGKKGAFVKPKVNLRDAIAEDIDRYIVENSLTILPSVVALAQQFHASASTILNAIHLLEKRGRLKCFQGRRAECVVRNDKQNRRPTKTHLPANVSVLYQKFVQLISDATFKAGEPLPKFDYLTAQYRISRNYLPQVMELLQKDNLIHKDGKKWIVGRGPVKVDNAQHISVTAEAPVVLVLVHEFPSWSKLSRRIFLASLPSAMVNAFDKCGIRILIVGSIMQSSDILFTSSYPDVIKTADALGRRMLGTVAIIQDMHRSLKPDPERWIRHLARSNRPFVWVDINGRLPNKGWDGLNLDKQTRHNCRRFFFDINSAVKLCVDTLASHGHQHVAIPFFSTPSMWQWSKERVQKVQEFAAQCPTPMTIFADDIAGDIWLKFFDMSQSDPGSTDFQIQILHPTRINCILDTLVQEKESYVQGTIYSQSLLLATKKHLPFLYQVVTNKSITALIAPNDLCAHVLYYWIIKLGVSIPADLSIISFDNFFQLNSRLCTIDFGTTDLGYCAAHAIIGDVPIGATKHSDFGSRSMVINRGSLGTARTK